MALEVAIMSSEYDGSEYPQTGDLYGLHEHAGLAIEHGVFLRENRVLPVRHSGIVTLDSCHGLLGVTLNDIDGCESDARVVTKRATGSGKEGASKNWHWY